VPDQHGRRQANLRAHRHFDTRLKFPMECETRVVSVSFGDAEIDVSVLKKADRGALVSQVKNWITSWVNYCENEAEYLKSFSLFTAFMDRSDVKARFGEYHS
jgi:hypothetical protein